ncbi:subunit beta of nuclear transcription factor Y [Hamiltosporidium tvaerminnensis]|uniref:Subunit beta of nuclear transcription factor Y n=3 Tax=Hamiltosporidium TaxID=1176354 RepID=A0A4Q9LE06_9MICR|nr:subunit beta of nuclear transcription factor Y [Hamiltosporidium tvaerminnensis]TBU06168.1 subunit beta of nuclear transcription factor Y [Hamiltosporidium magnivora]
MEQNKTNMKHNRNNKNEESSEDMDETYLANLKTTDRLLPIANISKIMKNPIPKVAKVAKDAKELMQKSASEFIAVVTCMAKEICESENRKTLTGDDLIRAMEQLGMPYYAELTRKYFVKYKEGIKNGRPRARHNSLIESIDGNDDD